MAGSLIRSRPLHRQHERTVNGQAGLPEPRGLQKDRVARGIVEEAERTGELKPGQPVVELTSGNTGTGLAIVCGVKGYPFVAVMSKGNSAERARMMAALGAEVVLVDQQPGSVPGQVTGEEARRAARRLATEEGIFAGFSSGANLAAALRLLNTEMCGKTIAIMMGDSGLKYLSTDLWPASRTVG